MLTRANGHDREALPLAVGFVARADQKRSTREVHPKFSEAPHLTLTLLGPQSRFGDK